MTTNLLIPEGRPCTACEAHRYLTRYPDAVLLPASTRAGEPVPICRFGGESEGTLSTSVDRAAFALLERMGAIEPVSATWYMWTPGTPEPPKTESERL